MCRDMIEAHHGRIRVDSSVGRGTAFTLKLPTVTKAAPKRPAAAPSSVAGAPVAPSVAAPIQMPVHPAGPSSFSR